MGLCILELLLVLGQLENFYDVCSSFCIILLPEEQGICVYHQVACIQKNTAWVENERVANRAIEIWGDIAELIKLFAAKAPSKQPKDNASFNNLKGHYTNEFIIVYLHLFRDVAACLNAFLIKFQTDGKMVLFFSKEIGGILCRLWVSLFEKRR